MSVVWGSEGEGPVVLLGGFTEYVDSMLGDGPEPLPVIACDGASVAVVRCVTAIELAMRQDDPRLREADSRVANFFSVDLDDHPDAAIRSILASTSDFIEANLSRGTSVVVHCQLGVSRSPTVVAAFLMTKRGFGVLDALTAIIRARPRVLPNEGFMRELVRLEFELKGESVGEEKVLAVAKDYAAKLFFGADGPRGADIDDGDGAGRRLDDSGVAWLPPAVRVGIDDYFDLSHALSMETIRRSSFTLPSRISRSGDDCGRRGVTAEEAAAAVQRAIAEYTARVAQAELETQQATAENGGAPNPADLDFGDEVDDDDEFIDRYSDD